MIKDAFSKRLKLAIENANINQSELAEKINVHRSTITHYLNGRYEPRRDRVDQFARVLSVSPAWLMGFDVPSEQESASPIIDKQELNEQVGSRIRQIRKDRNMTLLELADKVGLSEGTVQRYESGNINNVSVGIIQRFATALKVDPDFLVGWETARPNIQEQLESLVSQLSPNAGLAFLNGDKPMSDESKGVMYESIKSVYRLSLLLAQLDTKSKSTQ